MDIELPYFAEYAKSGRANCKGCKCSISQGTLRIAVMVQSAFYDGKNPNWFHENCFFKKQRPHSVGDIKNFENLRFEDQQKIEKLIQSLPSVVENKSNKKKRSKAENALVKDFCLEYAKSGRSTCRGCEQKIQKDQLRIRKTVYDTEVGMKYGGQPFWHHPECFAQLRGNLGWFDTGENIPGFNILSKDDKESIKYLIPLIKKEDLPAVKKPKLEIIEENDDNMKVEMQEKLKTQNELIFKFRDQINGNLRKNEIIEILEENDQEPVQGDLEKLLDQVSDLLTFGALDPCIKCQGRQLLFHKSGYLCNGDLSEWAKCANLNKEPKRQPCKIPKHLKQSYPFLNNVPKKTQARLINYIPPSSAIISKSLSIKTHSDENVGPLVKRERLPLSNFKFVIAGLKDKEDDIKKRIRKLGGECSTKITKETVAIISSVKEVKKQSSRMRKAEELGIHVVPPEYIDSVEEDTSGAINYINSMSLCEWGTDPSAKIVHDELKTSKSKSIYTKSAPKSCTLKVKDGLAVDPESGLEDVAHVYVDGNDKYNVVLGLTDIQSNKNSYYKIQLLESDRRSKFWIFRSWGRIGTTIGSNKVENFSSLYDALLCFKSLYKDKTGNDFSNRRNFVKMQGRMYPIDIEYDADKKVDLNMEHAIKSKLHLSVQNLIKLMFDIDTMKRTMMEFHLDMEKMPLGKLSIKQIQMAYSTLTEAYQLSQKNASNDEIIAVSNRFYTLIPHNFGVKVPPLLSSSEQIESLRETLDSLAEIECAYNLINAKEDNTKDVNPIDRHYEALKTQLDVLHKEDAEYKLLEQYVKNTHAETHKSYDLEIIDIFKVSRQGESRRYKPFKKLHNRKLLWHGSRLTNFVGILSHGLKIAPSEAPSTGYMFGKGIYFADMVSKSANYCCSSKQNSTGLLLLSEVALGDMVEHTLAKYITQLPKGKHSCFGRGRTMPNPKESYNREDGVEIPLGIPVTNDKLKTSLLYNEYVVYDTAQVNIQYLFRVHFKYKY